MKNYKEYKKEKLQNLFDNVKDIKHEELPNFIEICKSYISNNFNEKNNILLESIEHTRYSVEINYRTKKEDVLSGFAKITLGYVSAALKKEGYHGAKN